MQQCQLNSSWLPHGWIRRPMLAGSRSTNRCHLVLLFHTASRKLTEFGMSSGKK
jgi:hypothetical protein